MESANVFQDDVISSFDSFCSQGMFTSTDRKTLYCIVTIRQLEKVRRIIKEVDPGAFVSVFNTSILQGEGFRARTVLFEE